MGMNSSALSAAMKAAILAATAAWDDPADDHRLSGLTRADYWGAIATAISSTTVSHIQVNARCSGIDSHGDSHDNVQIV